MRITRTVILTAALVITAPALQVWAQAPNPASNPASNPNTPATAKMHKLAIQVNENKPEVMTLALNNAQNVLDYYKAKGELVQIEIVAYGPGLHMLRDDTSPVKSRIAALVLAEPNLALIACENTRTNQAKQEGKAITLMAEAKSVTSGVVRLMELQSEGYAYIRP